MPVVVVIEAKQENIKLGLGQCAATMVAAQRFNAQRALDIPTVYGSVTTGTAWRFLKLNWHCADNGLDGLFHPTCGSGAGNADLDAAIRLICLLHGSVSHHAL